ncbi:WD repeat-containing protein 75-like [Pomacea canaliculata]|uniref:WD repeat-containing protein 75-like n=1 Tax=Pomacea canaliculata TaxID=400727 RepID=UPI000D73CE27|nr:WD repeat-containing protein 75-like [Pomacea canaliculata]
MAAPEDRMDQQKDNVVLSLCAGASLVKGQTLFSRDSQFLFCCSGLVVKVFNTANGQCVQQLKGHKDVVTGLALHPGNKFQLLSCGLDGIINQWDFSDGVLLKSHDLHMPLHALLNMDKVSNTVTVVAHRPLDGSYNILRQKLHPGRSSKAAVNDKRDVHRKAEILISSCQHDHRTVSFGCGGDCIAAVNGNKLFVYSLRKRFHKKHHGDKSNPFTCIACHPTEHCLATGHKNGMITLWWNILSKSKVVTSSRHWHSLPVQTLSFTEEGSYFLSGGHECVLVKWHTNMEQRDFLPRLGAPLCNIACSPDGMFYATSHTDNGLQAIFHINFAIRGLARAHLGADVSKCDLPLGLIFDPRSKALVTNGRPGHLQFYCLRTDTQLFHLDIVGQNYISPDKLEVQVPVTEVEQAAFDDKGSWLLTFERWDDGVMTPEYRLKFWFYNREKQNYQLSTTIESPHKKRVVSVQFRPQSPSEGHMAVTSSEDGTFKLWRLVNKPQINKTMELWTCDSVGFYRDHPAGVARFSEDGSILAVAFGATLTLWDPDVNVLKAVVSDPGHSEVIRFVEFGGKSSPHLVVTATAKHYDSVEPHFIISVVACSSRSWVLVTDGDIMAVVSSGGDLFVFRPSSWKPVYSHTHLMATPIISSIFIPVASTRETGLQQDDGPLSWQNKSRLFLLDNQQHLLTLEYSSTLEGEKQSPQTKVQLEQVLPETPFSTLLSSAKLQKDHSSPANKTSGKAWQPASSVVERILQTSAHNLPHMRALCSEFIESLLQANSYEPSSQKTEESMEVEDE